MSKSKRINESTGIIKQELATYTFTEFFRCPTVSVIGIFDNLSDWQDGDFCDWHVVDQDGTILAMSDNDSSHMLPPRNWVKFHCMNSQITGEENYRKKIGKYSVSVSGDSMFIRDTTES